MELLGGVQILIKAVYISFHINAPGKGMNEQFSPPTMSK